MLYAKFGWNCSSHGRNTSTQPNAFKGVLLCLTAISSCFSFNLTFLKANQKNSTSFIMSFLYSPNFLRSVIYRYADCKHWRKKIQYPTMWFLNFSVIAVAIFIPARNHIESILLSNHCLNIQYYIWRCILVSAFLASFEIKSTLTDRKFNVRQVSYTLNVIRLQSWLFKK